MGLCNSKIKLKSGVKFSEIKHEIKPFDLILFRGSELVSDTIAFIEKYFIGDGSWTHVGMAVTTDVLPIKNGIDGKLYILESTMSGKLGDGVNNVETGKGDFGVQIRDLEHVIDKYDNDTDTRIGWCRLINNPIIKKDDETMTEYDNRMNILKENFESYYEAHQDDIFDYNCCALLKAINSNMPKWCGNDNMMFCSELVTEVYQTIGIIRKDIDPETVAPIELVNGLNPLFILPPMTITREWGKSFLAFF